MEETSRQHDSPTQFAPLDNRAFQSLYQENVGPIYQYVYGKVGNREEAEDLTSQVFIKAARYIDRRRTPHSARIWLFQVARTTIADYWRTYYRGTTCSLEALLETGWEGPAVDETEDEFFELHSNTVEHVQNILQRLSKRDCEILTCRFLLGLSIRETAARIGLTEGNVKASQFRALKHAAELEYRRCQR